MLKNYFKIAIRSFIKEKGYSLVNVLGLSLSLACTLIILLWVQDEYQVDRFHEKGERIAQVLRNYSNEDGSIQTRKAVPFPVAKALENEFAEVENAAASLYQSDCLAVDGEDSYLVDGTYAHFSIFNIFSIPLIEGNTTKKEDILEGVFISESLAEKYFGTDWKGNVLDKSILLEGGDLGQGTFSVQGVFENLPDNSSLNFDFVANINQFTKKHERWASWGSSAYYTYALLSPKVDFQSFENKISDLVQKNDADNKITLTTQAFEDNYLYSNFEDGKAVGGRIAYVRIFFFAAIFLLLIACINFINLTTARSTHRAQEVGIRKTIGANKKELFTQFMVETGLVTFISFLTAILISELLMPTANAVLGKSMSFDYSSLQLWMSFLVMTLLLTLLAGIYPSFILSSFSTVSILKNKLSEKFGSGLLRKGLVVVQFSLAALLLISTFIVNEQIGLIKNKNLGMDRSSILQIDVPSELREKTGTLISEFQKEASILSATNLSSNPIHIGFATDDLTWPGKDPNDETRIKMLDTDLSFPDVFKTEMNQGEFHFKKTDTSDEDALVINETAAKYMGLENPVGTQVSLGEDPMTIIGVIKDFHINSLHQSIQPLMIFNAPDAARQISIRYVSGQEEVALNAITAIYKKMVPGKPLQYSFLDDNYDKMYKSELLIGKLADFFSFIALFISCLGLLGLSAFSAERRAKEIGIRKVLGASVGNILHLMTKNFMFLAMLGFALAVPLAWYLTNSWLDDFVYKIEIKWWMFAVAALILSGITLITVFSQGLRAALQNPIKAINKE